ncbi:extracellular solute-binding protein [bacterium]|nr:extracellular solute-binding protein [bacterium]
MVRVVRNVGSREGFRMHWNEWKAAFERDNPGWKMKLVNAGDTQVKQYYMQRIAGHDLPPVIQTWNLTRFLADNGHLLPLPDDYYTKFGMPLPTPHKGKRYATMGSVQLQGIAVNRKLWQEIGVTEPPATWDAFVDGLRKLKAKGHKAMTYGALDWCAAMPLQYGLYANLYATRADEADTGKPSWTQRRDEGKTTFATDPAARKVLENLIQLATEFAGDAALSDGYDEAKSEFYRGKTGAWLMGCWIGGDLEPNKVALDIDYWPIPSMVGRKPIFLTGSYLQTGWAVTKAAVGPLEAKAFAVLDALYDPKVYQTWLNAESMIPSATKVSGVVGPQSEWPAARHFYDSMLASYNAYGVTRGGSITMADQPPIGLETTMKEVMQEVLTGKRDVDALLKKLDNAWDSLRKAEASSGAAK